MQRKPFEINYLLLPFSIIYGMAVHLRNKLFDWDVLESKSYDLPVICIGNLAVGGTGKTPFAEHVVGLLKDKYRVAVLSRGYGRKTKGFVMAADTSTANDIGDEPKQMKDKFGDSIIVAVDANRRRGIETLLASDDPPEAIVLDDAYQHRYIKPSLTVLLTSYSRLFTDDILLPAGRLRESAIEKHRADLIVVTKCPVSMTPIDYRVVIKGLNPFPYQNIFFTKVSYGSLQGIDGNSPAAGVPEIGKSTQVLLVTGIANPSPLKDYLLKKGCLVHEMEYADHYRFTRRDIGNIAKRFNSIDGGNKLIITTEKDATRLNTLGDALDAIKESLYVMPIKVEFMLKQQEMFDKTIINHVRKYIKKYI